MARQPLWSCCLQWRSTGNGAAPTRCVWALLGHLLHGRVVRAVLPGCVAASQLYGVPGELHASTLASTLACLLPRAGARCGDSCADAAPRIRCAADLKVCKAAQLAAVWVWRQPAILHGGPWACWGIHAWRSGWHALAPFNLAPPGQFSAAKLAASSSLVPLEAVCPCTPLILTLNSCSAVAACSQAGCQRLAGPSGGG